MLREKVTRFAKQMFAGMAMAMCVAAIVPATQAEAALYESEPNNNPATADVLPLNTWMEGTTLEMDEEDWYTFTITKPGATQIEIKPTKENTSDANWWVTLEDANRRKIREFYAHSYTDYKIGLAPGKYYIKVSFGYKYGKNVAYDLMVHYTQSNLWEQERYYGDKTIANANIAYTKNIYSGNLYCQDDVDWYRFKLSGNNKVSVRFTIDDTVSNPGRWYVELIEYNSRKILKECSVGANETLTIDKCNGDLIVKIRNSYNAYYDIYHLQTTATPISASNKKPSTSKPSTNKPVTVTKPSATNITSLKAGKRKATISWKKASKATGYYVYRATSAKGAYKKIATINGKTSYTDKNSLKSKKRYYYKVVSFRKSGSKIATAKASAVKSVKIK